MRQVYSQTSAAILSGVLLLSGCTSILVRDDVKRTAGLDGHCAGSEWVDDSSLAVLPVPVVLKYPLMCPTNVLLDAVFV